MTEPAGQDGRVPQPNPDCTRGESERTPDGFVRIWCGCGWEASGVGSRRLAHAMQKAHRFPPVDGTPPRLSDYAAGRGGSARAPRRDAAPPTAPQPR